MMLITPLYAQQVELRFQPEIDEKASRLGHLLVIRWSKAPPTNWENTPLDSHPAPGEIITKTKIVDWMTQKLGPFDSTWIGKTKIRVKQSSISSGKSLREKAKTELIKRLKTRYLRVKVTPLSHIKDSQYALDKMKTRIDLSFPVSKRVCVWLSHGDKQRIAVWFKVEAYTNVLVAKHRIRSNTPLKNNMFITKIRNIAGLNSPPVMILTQDNWLKSSMERYAILLNSQLKHPPLILQGQHVKLTIQHHGITIAMDTIALKEGYAGDVITVKNIANQKTFSAKITGLQQAEIIL